MFRRRVDYVTFKLDGVCDEKNSRNRKEKACLKNLCGMQHSSFSGLDLVRTKVSTA